MLQRHGTECHSKRKACVLGHRVGDGTPEWGKAWISHPDLGGKSGTGCPCPVSRKEGVGRPASNWGCPCPVGEKSRDHVELQGRWGPGRRERMLWGTGSLLSTEFDLG